MDLKTFVAESLKQIAEGIKEAQAANTGALIAPRLTVSEKGIQTISGIRPNCFAPQRVTFDIAVSAVEKDTVEGGGGIRVMGFRAGADAQSVSQNTTVSRISFEVPISWPEGRI